MRPINRALLASFVEYAVNGAVSNKEWDRFIVNHYQDPIMEHARHECSKIFHDTPSSNNLTIEQRDILLGLAKELRHSA